MKILFFCGLKKKVTAIRKRDRGESSIEESNCNFVKKLQNKCKKYTSHYQDIDFSLTKVPDFLGN